MVSRTTDINFYEAIRHRLGDKEAEAVVSFIDAKLENNNQANLKTLATKEDITELKLKLTEVKTNIRWLYALMMPLLLAILGLYFK